MTKYDINYIIKFLSRKDTDFYLTYEFITSKLDSFLINSTNTHPDIYVLGIKNTKENILKILSLELYKESNIDPKDLGIFLFQVNPDGNFKIENNFTLMAKKYGSSIDDVNVTFRSSIDNGNLFFNICWMDAYKLFIEYKYEFLI